MVENEEAALGFVAADLLMSAGSHVVACGSSNETKIIPSGGASLRVLQCQSEIGRISATTGKVASLYNQRICENIDIVHVTTRLGGIIVQEAERR